MYHVCACERSQAGEKMLHPREVKVTESSESVLAGTKRPPFRLVVRMVHESGRRLQIRPAVSEEFVVSPISPSAQHHRPSQRERHPSRYAVFTQLWTPHLQTINRLSIQARLELKAVSRQY